MKKRIMTATGIAAAAAAVLCLGACGSASSSASLTYNIENGDEITVTVDTTEGYMLNNDGAGQFSVSYDSDLVAEGSFKLGDDESWQILIDDLNGYDAELIDGKVEDGVFIVYIPSYKEYDYYEYIDNSETVVSMRAYSEEDIYDAINVTSFAAE